MSPNRVTKIRQALEISSRVQSMPFSISTTRIKVDFQKSMSSLRQQMPPSLRWKGAGKPSLRKQTSSSGRAIPARTARLAGTNCLFCLKKSQRNDRPDKYICKINQFYLHQCNLFDLSSQQITYHIIDKTSHIITLMDKFITQYVEPLLLTPLTPDQRLEKLTLLETDLKIFVTSYAKNEVALVNKELAKKSRELFICSSDNETLKQAIEEAQNALQSVKSQMSVLEQQKTKQKIMNEKQISDLNKNIENLEKQMKKESAKLKMEKQILEETYKVKIREIRNEHQQELNRVIDEEKRIQEEQTELLKRQFDEEKARITKDNSDKKREIIKKYEEKIAKLTGEYEDKLYLLNQQFQQHKKESRDSKYNLQNKIASLQNNVSRLKIELAKEEQSHQKYLKLYNETFNQLSVHQENSLKEKQQIEQQLHEVKLNLAQQERKYVTDMRDLNNLLKKTIEEKDTLFINTVETLQTEFRIKIDSQETQLVEQKEIAVTEIQIKRDKENYDHQMRYQALQEQMELLNKKYVSLSSEHQIKIQRLISEHQDYISSLNSRKEYELSVNGKNSEREFLALKNKYELEIRAIYAQHAKELEELNKKNNDEKIALANKLTTQYETMIGDQKVSNQIQIKQKLIQFDRKAKGYEAKLKDAEKKRNQLKVTAERIKMQMQMRVDSMVELNQVYEGEIVAMNEKVQNCEREKERVINDYELKILIIKNQMKATKQEYEQREVELKELLEGKLNTKNSQMNKILARVKKQTQALVEAHEKRVQAIEKQYNELKRVVGQKTSLPEDIQALKVFHGAYIEKEKELELERQKVQHLYRELKAKDAIDKVFAEKGSKKIHNKNSNLFPNTLISLKSNQI